MTWSKDNIVKFVDYYRVVNLPFMLQMEQEYTKLSPGNKFFLILQDMGMTDQQMTHILSVSDGALRTTRSRLRQKRTAAIATKQRLARELGVFVGISAGAAVAAAIDLVETGSYDGKTIVAILPDTGERYLSMDV